MTSTKFNETMKRTESWFLLYIVSGYNNDEYCIKEKKNQPDWD